METPANYTELNRQLWNAKTEYHVRSEFYDVEGFLGGKSSLNAIELGLLGDLKGKSVLHLQCHFGQDSLSLSRLGAHVTGVDLADEAIAKARELAAQLALPAEFVCCDVYELPQHLHQQFDILFTSYGVLGWLPDLGRWAGVISHFLKPGGKLILVEFHPVAWMFDDAFSRVQYSYFNRETITEVETGTYAARAAPLEHTAVSWNHDLSEVLGSLLRNGLTISHFAEYDYSPYECFERMEQVGEGKYQIQHLAGKLPMIYSVVATRS